MLTWESAACECLLLWRSVMHYLMPKRGILSLHSGCNMGQAGDVTLFFGLSGTGQWGTVWHCSWPHHGAALYVLQCGLELLHHSIGSATAPFLVQVHFLEVSCCNACHFPSFCKHLAILPSLMVVPIE
jgi:hypothetical protein